MTAKAEESHMKLICCRSGCKRQIVLDAFLKVECEVYHNDLAVRALTWSLSLNSSRSSLSNCLRVFQQHLDPPDISWRGDCWEVCQLEAAAASQEVWETAEEAASSSDRLEKPLSQSDPSSGTSVLLCSDLLWPVSFLSCLVPIRLTKFDLFFI